MKLVILLVTDIIFSVLLYKMWYKFLKKAYIVNGDKILVCAVSILFSIVFPLMFLIYFKVNLEWKNILGIMALPIVCGTFFSLEGIMIIEDSYKNK